MHLSISMPMTNDVFIFFMFFMDVTNMIGNTIELNMNGVNIEIIYDVDIDRKYINVACFNDALQTLGFILWCKDYGIQVYFRITIRSDNIEFRKMITNGISENIVDIVLKYLDNICNNKCKIGTEVLTIDDINSNDIYVTIVLYDFEHAKDLVDTHRNVLGIIDSNADKIMNEVVQRFSST